MPSRLGIPATLSIPLVSCKVAPLITRHPLFDDLRSEISSLKTHVWPHLLLLPDGVARAQALAF
jgi:hypothetical protein